MPDTIRLIIADDHDIVLTGVQSALAQHPDMHIVHTLKSGEHLIHAVNQYHPHIIITDLKMRGSDPLTLLETLGTQPHAPRVIIISATADLFIANRGLDLGLAGYLLKEDGLSEELPRAIRIAFNGGYVLSKSIEEALNGSIAPRQTYGLNDEQYDVLCLMVKGLTNAEIAQKLPKSDSAVYSQVGRILKALGVSTREQAIILAIKEKLIPYELLGPD